MDKREPQRRHEGRQRTDHGFGRPDGGSHHYDHLSPTSSFPSSAPHPGPLRLDRSESSRRLFQGVETDGVDRDSDVSGEAVTITVRGGPDEDVGGRRPLSVLSDETRHRRRGAPGRLVAVVVLNRRPCRGPSFEDVPLRRLRTHSPLPDVTFRTLNPTGIPS